MSKATRQAFGEALVQLGEAHSQIVVLDADLSKSTKSEIFAKKFPDRFFEMGISEANMIGVAAGLSFTGHLPFLCSFGCFITGRYDTIRLSVAYSQANVRIIGTHAGIAIGEDGHSQMGLEDIALMRALPTMGVFQPMDAQETLLIMNYLVTTWRGPAYLRLTRQNLPDLYPKNKSFQPGKLMEIMTAHNPRIICIATGAGVAEAVQAAQILYENKISMSVWNAHCLKPFDDATILELAKTAEWILTVEDHSIIGGLGSCVAEALASIRNSPCLIRIGIQDCFGESGEASQLYDHFGISAKAIVKSVQKFFKEDGMLIKH